MTGRPPVPLLDRFWSKVVVASPDQCWIWMGAPDKDGYGRIKTYGDKMVKAHRLSYEIHIGEIPSGKMVMHSCDNPPCVNPNHLSVGTAKDNNRDRSVKGRDSRGETHPSSKLTADDVRVIQWMADNGVRTCDVRSMYPQLAWESLASVMKRETWKHVR